MKFTEPLTNINFIAQSTQNETLFIYSCNLSLKQLTKEQIMKKYGQKHNAYAGMVKSQHFDDIKKDAETHNKNIKELSEFLQKYQSDKSLH